MEYVVSGTTLRLIQGDITEQDVDAVVNAANSSLMGGGGVDGAIHSAGGPAIKAECEKIRERHDKLPVGEAVITTAGELPAERVIHTVGPRWKGGGEGEPELLSNAYRNSLAVAAEEGMRTVAFPSISTGAYGYPVGKAARRAISAVREFLTDEERAGELDEVWFVLFSDSDLESYSEAAEELLAEADSA